MISNCVQGFTESVIRETTRVNDQHGGINLAQGMPNSPPPRELIQAAHRALDGDFHQYAITWGTPRLRRAIADKYRRLYGMELDPDLHITVCCGSTEAMLATLLAVLNPGDYILADVAHFLSRHGCRDDHEFAMFLIKEIGVATVPGSSFYAHPEPGRTKIRFCFPETDDVLIEAGQRLQKLGR